MGYGRGVMVEHIEKKTTQMAIKDKQREVLIQDYLNKTFEDSKEL